MHDDVLTRDEWTRLGFHDVVELGGGWQSRVFTARRCEESFVVKLTHAHLVDSDILMRKAMLIENLARLDAAVVGPVPVCGSLVHPFGEWLVAAARLIEGKQFDESGIAHGELLGRALAGLHQSMSGLPTIDIPRVAALESDTSGRWDSTDADQLLHGDFAASNLIQTVDGIRIFDFDDCGYGPVEFDIANSLYMVMFDSWVNDRPLSRYQEFRTAFVGGYTTSAGRAIDGGSIDSMIEVRIAALKRWAENPSEAPIGIRDSPPEWIDTLNRFVQAWLDGSM